MDLIANERATRLTKSVSSFAALWTLLILGVTMVLLGGVRWITTPGVRLDSGVLNHGWPLLALGTGIFLITWVIRDRSLLSPLRNISSQLCGVEAGYRPRPLEVRTDIHEIRTVVEAFNLVIRRLEQRFDERVIEKFQENFESIRTAIASIADRSPEQAAEILDHLAVLENAFTSIVGGRLTDVHGEALAGKELSIGCAAHFRHMPDSC